MTNSDAKNLLSMMLALHKFSCLYLHFLILFWAQIIFMSAKCLSLLNLVHQDRVLDYSLIYFQYISHHLHFTEHRKDTKWVKWFWLYWLEMAVQLVTCCLILNFWILIWTLRGWRGQWEQKHHPEILGTVYAHKYVCYIVTYVRSESRYG